MIFRQELDLLWSIENQWSEKTWNEDLGQNHEIDQPNDIQINKFTYEQKALIRGFQRDQNCRISPYILWVITPQVKAQIWI